MTVNLTLLSKQSLPLSVGGISASRDVEALPNSMYKHIIRDVDMPKNEVVVKHLLTEYLPLEFNYGGGEGEIKANHLDVICEVLKFKLMLQEVECDMYTMEEGTIVVVPFSPSSTSASTSDSASLTTPPLVSSTLSSATDATSLPDQPIYVSPKIFRELRACLTYDIVAGYEFLMMSSVAHASKWVQLLHICDGSVVLVKSDTDESTRLSIFDEISELESQGYVEVVCDAQDLVILPELLELWDGIELKPSSNPSTISIVKVSADVGIDVRKWIRRALDSIKLGTLPYVHYYPENGGGYDHEFAIKCYNHVCMQVRELVDGIVLGLEEGEVKVRFGSQKDYLKWREGIETGMLPKLEDDGTLTVPGVVYKEEKEAVGVDIELPDICFTLQGESIPDDVEQLWKEGKLINQHAKAYLRITGKMSRFF